MNERIKELAKQAGIKITPMIVDGIEYEYEDVDMDGSEDLAKFADLIVRECAELIESQHAWKHTWITSVAASNLIRKHFGVKK